MAATYTTTIDEKGRLVVPSDLRRQFGFAAGDAVFIQADEDGIGIRFAKAINPFDALAAHAMTEREEGRTRTLRAFAEDEGIELDGE